MLFNYYNEKKSKAYNNSYVTIAIKGMFSSVSLDTWDVKSIFAPKVYNSMYLLMVELGNRVYEKGLRQ